MGSPNNTTINELYSQGMRAYQMWDEAKKYFVASPGSKRRPTVGTVAKDLALADVNLGEFLTSKYSLWIDLRTGEGVVGWCDGAG